MGRTRHCRGWPPFSATLWHSSLLLLCLLAVVPAAQAQEEITDVRVSVHPQAVAISAQLSGGLPDKVGNEITNGIRKELYYYVVLKRQVPLWKDEEIASATVRFSIRYDLVKKQFIVIHRQHEKTTRHLVTQFDDVRRLISHIRDVTILVATPPRRGDSYYVSIKAEMRSAKLPVYIEYFLFFLPVAQLTTPWTNSDSIPMDDLTHP